jgi:drug/metabolite transporter (DMT)-like permease
MAKSSDELERFAAFTLKFFPLLIGISSALPFVERVLGFLPQVIRYQDIAAILASVCGMACIGGSYLSLRKIQATGERIKLGGKRTRERFFGVKDLKAAFRKEVVTQVGNVERSHSHTAGLLLVVLGVLLAVSYYIFAPDLLNVQQGKTNALTEMIALVWYLSLYSALVMGLTQISLFAYLTQEDIRLDP